MGVRSIEETTSAMHKIKQSVTGYSGLVTRLGTRSEEIGKILGVIVEVTERTNLLALNASILAAQAGEQGRGSRSWPRRSRPWPTGRPVRRRTSPN